ncbi:MAG: hypothetical protein V4538_07560 [Bacteroidota bacterium]
MTIEENPFYHKKGDYESRKDLLIHYLKVLHESNKPITFSDLFLDNMPGGGMPEFESVMTELETKNWIIKTEKDGGPVPGLPFHRKVDKRYSISLEGVEYLAAVGLIDDKHKNTMDNKYQNITNYGNMVVGDNPKEVNQTSSNFEINPKYNKTKPDNMNKIATIVGIVLTIVGLIIGYLQLVKS